MSPQARKVRVVFPNRIFTLFILLLGFGQSFLLLPNRVSTQAPETCVQPPPGIIAWWTFDETSGTTAEDIVGGINGVHINGPVPTPGKVDGALRFDGGSSYVGAPDSDLWAFGTNDFTIELWANWDAPGSGDIVHAGDVLIGNDEGPGSQNKWFFALGGGLLHFTVYNELDPPSNFYLVRAPFSPTVGQWYHLAVTKRGTLFTIYVNGTPVGSEISTSPIANPDAPLIIGQSNEPFGGFMNGLLDEVTIYNRALTQGELQRIVDAGSAGKCKQLTITTKSLSAARLGDFFSQQMETRFGQPPFTWSTVGGTLPAGVSLSSEGVLSGTPTEAGSFTFTFRVTDSNNQIAEQTFKLDVLLTVPPPDIQIQLTGTTLVPGRELTVFAVIENIGNVSTDHIPVAGLLYPWHDFREAQPTPSNIINVNVPFPPIPSGSSKILEWDVPPLEPGESAILSFEAGLHSQYPLDQQHRLELCMAVRPTKNCEKRIVIDLPAIEECIRIEEQDCFGPLPPQFAYDCSEKVRKRCYDRHTRVECVPTPTPTPTPTGAATNVSVPVDQATLLDCADWENTTRGPVDPNEKVVIAKRFIQPDQLLVYPIHFENIGDVEARDVFVTDALDPTLDASTLNLLTPTGGSFDVATRTVRWDLLNRNLEPGETGNVLLSVRPRPGLPSGTVIRNSATIQFEVFQPLVTNEVVNIIDSTRPASVVTPLPAETATLDFPISWSGSDSVGEIDFYSILVSVDGGAFTPFLERTRETSATFTGEVGKSYGFLAIATDTAGNIEVQPAIAEASTRIVSNCATGGDNQPPTITGESASPTTLWPPNHTMRDIAVDYTAGDDCPFTCTLSVTSNEPVNGTSDGDTAPDWEIVDAHHVRLRAERAATGNGRFYTTTITCTDGAGNSTSKDVAVFVAHNITSPASGVVFEIGPAVNFTGTFWDLRSDLKQ